MKRDFKNEAPINIVIRIIRAVFKRVRGKCYFYLGSFSQESSPEITFGKGARFINSKSITLKDNVHFGLLSRLECFGKGVIFIGKSSSCGDYVHIGSVSSISIGENVLIGSNVLIIDHNHGSPKIDLESNTKVPPRERPLSTKGLIIIEDNVWIGDGVVILSGVTIGAGSIIGANTIVKNNIDSNTIYAT